MISHLTQECLVVVVVVVVVVCVCVYFYFQFPFMTKTFKNKKPDAERDKIFFPYLHNDKKKIFLLSL